VKAIYFDIGFDSKSSKKDELERRAKSVGADFMVLDVKKQFFDDILFKPKYGYGKHFNPCIDCHANMFRQAFSRLKELNASFLISGEVLGQRPKSQRAEALKQVEKLSGAEGLILRPLSAKLLEPSTPESKGWVDREMLEAIEGRSRVRQLELASKFKLDDLPSPAGGCLLTEESVSDRIEDIRNSAGFSVEEIPLVKCGRYFILPEGARLVVGRDFEDNQSLQKTKSKNFSPILQEGLVGPYSFLQNSASKNDLELASKIVLAYSKGVKKQEEYSVCFQEQIVTTSPLQNKEEAREFLIHNKG
ncbi:MAG: ATP-binding protein, partial [Campylobacterales bacterium]